MQGTWKCAGAETNTVFDEVEFEGGEWTDYDEKVRRFQRMRVESLLKGLLMRLRRSPKNRWQYRLSKVNGSESSGNVLELDDWESVEQI